MWQHVLGPVQHTINGDKGCSLKYWKALKYHVLNTIHTRTLPQSIAPCILTPVRGRPTHGQYSSSISTGNSLPHPLPVTSHSESLPHWGRSLDDEFDWRRGLVSVHTPHTSSERAQLEEWDNCKSLLKFLQLIFPSYILYRKGYCNTLWPQLCQLKNFFFKCEGLHQTRACIPYTKRQTTSVMHTTCKMKHLRWE